MGNYLTPFFKITAMETTHETINLGKIGLIPLRNFAVVAPGIYRSAQPLSNHDYEWLKNMLGVKTIVNLRSESHHDDLKAKNSFNIIDVSIQDHHAPTLEQAQQFMDLIKSGQQRPILIHCEHGHGRTSTFSALANIARGMSVKDAIRNEEETYHYLFHHNMQKEFLLENFS